MGWLTQARGGGLGNGNIAKGGGERSETVYTQSRQGDTFCHQALTFFVTCKLLILLELGDFRCGSLVFGVTIFVTMVSRKSFICNS